MTLEEAIADYVRLVDNSARAALEAEEATSQEQQSLVNCQEAWRLVRSYHPKVGAYLVPGRRILFVSDYMDYPNPVKIVD